MAASRCNASSSDSGLPAAGVVDVPADVFDSQPGVLVFGPVVDVLKTTDGVLEASKVVEITDVVLEASKVPVETTFGEAFNGVFEITLGVLDTPANAVTATAFLPMLVT